MTFYVFSWGISFLSSNILGFFIFLRSARTRPQKLWGIFCFLVGLVSLGFIGSFLSASKDIAIWFIKLINISAVFLPSIFFDFVISFCSDYRKNIFFRRLSRINYFLSACFLFLILFTSLVVVGAELKLGLQYWLIAGPLYLLLAAYFAILS